VIAQNGRIDAFNSVLCPLFLIWRVFLWVGHLVVSFLAFSWGCCWVGHFGGGAGTLIGTPAGTPADPTSTPMALAGRGRAGVIIARTITTTKPGKETAPEALQRKKGGGLRRGTIQNDE
jgi:hypothetical protein